MMVEKRTFSEFMSELIILADEVIASFDKNTEVEIDAFIEFAMLVEKLVPIFNDLRDKDTIMDKPSIRQSLESLEVALSRAKALTKNNNWKDPIKQIADITHDIGRSLGLILVASLEVSTDFKEEIGTLQKEFMNARFVGNMSIPSSSTSSEFVNDLNVAGEIEEEIVHVTIEDVVLQLKNGNHEEFAVALLRLKKFIQDDELDSCLVNEEAVVAVLFNRLCSSKADNRLTIIQLLRGIALRNDKTKEKMTDTEFLSAVVKSLTRDADERREAVGLLLELSDLPAVRRQIGRIQGCIVMLVSILNENDTVASQDAAKLLDLLSSNTQNALHMSEAGYFKPLVQYLKKGSDMNKILMATALSRLVLTDHSKLLLGKDGAIEPLVNMFHTGKLESKLSALNALQNLSSVMENVQLLIRSGIAGSLLQLLFSVTSVLMTLREPASAILARIAQSESILVNQDVAQQMLSLLNLCSPVIQGHLLEALNSIAAHPRASKVRRKMKEKGALQLILPFLKETNTQIRSKALSLLYTLSKDLTDELSEHLDESHLINIVNIISSSTSDSEKAAAVGILSNLPVSGKKVTDVLKKANLLPILISIMDSSTGSNTTTSILAESVACVMIRFTSSTDKKLQLYSAEHGVIPLLVKLLSTGSAITKFRAATALAQLSQNSLSLRRSRKSRWLCVNPSVNAYCEVHDGYCFVNTTFCLVKAGAVSPLIKILEDKEWEAVEAALSALSTLLQDEIWEGGVDCIAKNSGVQAIVKVLEAGDVKVQEKALWMLERIFKVQEHRVKYGESAQVFLIDLAQTCDSRLKSIVAKVLAELELLQVQSSSVREQERKEKMKDADVSKQIQQMIRFIRQEAEEKANEITLAAEEEFNIEKLQLLEAEKRKIKQEYERKSKQIDVRRKIEYSMQLNAARIRVLQAQDEAVNSMKDAAKKALLNLSNDKKAYRKILKDMLIQGLLRLREPSVIIRCREGDKKLVETLIEEAKKEYSQKANVQPPKITLDDRVYLPPPPKNAAVDSHEPFCSGGVVLASEDGKIVLENTLDARLDVIFRQKLPEIRKRLLA